MSAALKAQTTRPPTGDGASDRTYHAPYDPQHQRSITAETKELALSLKKKEPCEKCPRAERFVFEVMEKRGPRAWEFRLGNDTAQVDEAHIVSNSRAVIIGRATAHLSVVNLVDFTRPKLLDWFFGFRPAVSRDKHLVAYVKFFPEYMGYGYWVTDEYLVYDLSRSPEENRPRGISINNHYDVGLPVYPEGSKNAPNDNILFDEHLGHSMSSDGFFWLGRGNNFTFVDQWKGIKHLIAVSLAGGMRRPKVEVKPLSDLGVIDTVKCNDLSQQAFQVSQIETVNAKPGYLRLHFRTWNPSCLKEKDLVIPPNSDSPQAED